MELNDFDVYVTDVEYEQYEQYLSWAISNEVLINNWAYVYIILVKIIMLFIFHLYEKTYDFQKEKLFLIN